MEPKTESEEPPSDPTLSVRMAEDPCLVPRNHQVERRKLRRSTRLAYLFQLEEEGRLSEGQMRFLVQLQASVNWHELERARELYEKLKESPRSFARSSKEREMVWQTTPALDAKSPGGEIRRIGVGYRDKGSLRPLHERGRNEGVAILGWSEDLAPFLLFQVEEPRWITTEEVFGPERYSPIQELALRQALMNSQYYISLFSGDR